MIKDKFGIYWDLPNDEVCKVCGQPDNCGDCNHHKININDAAKLGGIKSFWVVPRPDLGLNIFGAEMDSTFSEDNEMNKHARSHGYVYGKWYSLRCPDGELGSQHITRCFEIDPVVFMAAQETRWEASLVELSQIIRGAMQDYQKMRAEQASRN